MKGIREILTNSKLTAIYVEQRKVFYVIKQCEIERDEVLT